MHKQEVKEISDGVRSTFKEIVDLATEAGDLRLKVENQQEGLEATRSAYLELVGDEKTAKSLGDLGRLETWHEVSTERLDEWRRVFQIPPGPELPNAPQLETGLSVDDYVPSNALPEALDEYRLAVSRAADKLVAALRAQTAMRSPRVESLRDDIQARLGGEQNATPEVADEAEQYRTRLSMLEQKASDLAELDKRIIDDLDVVDSLIDQATESWADLRQARKVACTTVNKSMTSFFVRLTPDSLTTDIDKAAQ